MDKSLNKSGNIQKYGEWGLLIFVVIPLPGTGVWSGSLAAALLTCVLSGLFLQYLLET